jgi:hypothetical protein
MQVMSVQVSYALVFGYTQLIHRYAHSGHNLCRRFAQHYPQGLWKPGNCEGH